MFGQFSVTTPSPGTVLGGLALIVATSRLAVAAIPGGDKTVTVDVAKDGAIKAVDAEAGKSCQGSEAPAKLASTDPGGTAVNADLLAGQDAAAFLGATAKVADADKLGRKDSPASRSETGTGTGDEGRDGDGDGDGDGRG